MRQSPLRPAYESLFLALNDCWSSYHHLLKECRKDPKRGWVHQLRTILRRFIAALDLIDETVVLKDVCRLRSQLKSQLDALRDLRDLQVQEKALKASRPGARLVDFRKFLRERRKLEQKLAKQCLQQVDTKKLGAHLLRIDEYLRSWALDPQKRRQAIQALRDILTRDFEILRTCAARSKISDPATLHKTRIQFKRYRYAWEALAQTFPLPSSTQARMKELQALLGEIQDTVVMIRYLFLFLGDRGQTHPELALLSFLRAKEKEQELLMQRFQTSKDLLLNGIQPSLSPRSGRKAA